MRRPTPQEIAAAGRLADIDRLRARDVLAAASTRVRRGVLAAAIEPAFRGTRATREV